jgi:anti-sigma B factor antagonist
VTDANGTPLLEIDVLATELATTVVVAGEIDFMTVPTLDVALAEVAARGVGDVAVDLAAVEFIDSVGLHALLQARAALAHRGRRMFITAMSSSVARLLDYAAVTDAFKAPNACS